MSVSGQSGEFRIGEVENARAAFFPNERQCPVTRVHGMQTEVAFQRHGIRGGLLADVRRDLDQRRAGAADESRREKFIRTVDKVERAPMAVEDSRRSLHDQTMQLPAPGAAAERFAEPVQEIEDLLFLRLQGAPFAADKLQSTLLPHHTPTEVGRQSDEKDKQCGHHGASLRDMERLGPPVPRHQGGVAVLRVFVLEEFEHVFEADRVFRAGGHEILVRFDDCLALRGAGGAGFRAFHRGGLGRGSCVLHGENAVQTEIAQDAAVAGISVHDGQLAVRTQPECDASESAEES